jgi:hypothetical protein
MEGSFGWAAARQWELCGATIGRCGTAVHVQHLPGDVTRLSEKDDGFSDVGRIGDCAHGRKSFHDLLWRFVVERSIDLAGCDRVKAYVVRGVFKGETAGDGVEAAFGHHGNGGVRAGHGIIGESRGGGGDAAACSLLEHLFDGELSDEEEAFEVGGEECAKIFGGVFNKRPGVEDSCVIDQMVERSEGFDRGFGDFRSG